MIFFWICPNYFYFFFKSEIGSFSISSFLLSFKNSSLSPGRSISAEIKSCWFIYGSDLKEFDQVEILSKQIFAVAYLGQSFEIKFGKSQKFWHWPKIIIVFLMNDLGWQICRDTVFRFLPNKIRLVRSEQKIWNRRPIFRKSCSQCD